MKKILIHTDRISIEAQLIDSPTAQAIWDTLPIQAVIKTWGDEIYFPIPVHLKLEAGQEVVQEGDLGYWPEGHAFCIFFGPTPMSKHGEIHPASPVNVFGNVLDDLYVLKEVSSGENIFVEPLNA